MTELIQAEDGAGSLLSMDTYVQSINHTIPETLSAGFQSTGRAISKHIFPSFDTAVKVNADTYGLNDYIEMLSFSNKYKDTRGVVVVGYIALAYIILMTVVGMLTYCCKKLGLCKTQLPGEVYKGGGGYGGSDTYDADEKEAETRKRISTWKCIHILILFLNLIILFLSSFMLYMNAVELYNILDKSLKGDMHEVTDIFSKYVEKTEIQLKDTTDKFKIGLNNLDDQIVSRLSRTESEIKNDLESKIISPLINSYDAITSERTKLTSTLRWTYVNNTFIIAETSRLQANLSKVFRNLKYDLEECGMNSKFALEKKTCTDIINLSNDIIPKLDETLSFNDTRIAEKELRQVNMENVELSFHSQMDLEVGAFIKKLQKDLENDMNVVRSKVNFIGLLDMLKKFNETLVGLVRTNLHFHHNFNDIR